MALQMEGKAGWTLAQGEEGKGRGTGLFIEFHFILPFLLPFIHSFTWANPLLSLALSQGEGSLSLSTNLQGGIKRGPVFHTQERKIGILTQKESS